MTLKGAISHDLTLFVCLYTFFVIVSRGFLSISLIKYQIFLSQEIENLSSTIKLKSV